MATIVAGVVGVLFVAGMLAWVKLVPDEKRRMRGVIAMWIALPFIEVGLYALNRHLGLY